MNDISQYMDKALAGWLGKNIGGTLGGPYEAYMAPLYLNFYEPIPSKAAPNDDLDLQLVWLSMMREKGIFFVPEDLAQCWLHNITYHISEYFMSQRNLALGLRPPVSGAFNNWFHNGMGATIRSEIWAMMAPGRPDLAVGYAYLDGSVDHQGDGLYGELLMAAMESAAFECSDPLELIETGLSYIPAESEVSRVVRFVRDGFQRGVCPLKLRHLICADFSHPTDGTYVPVNLGFIILGLLYGGDFGDAICRAVNCGYDTDCTGASLGSLLGIMHGQKYIPEAWLKPIGREIIPGWGVSPYGDSPFPEDVEELAEAIFAFSRQVAEREDEVRLHLWRWTGLEFLRRKSGPKSVPMPAPTRVTLACREGLRLAMDYLDDPAIGSQEIKRLELLLENETDDPRSVRLDLTTPGLWNVINLAELEANHYQSVLSLKPRECACLELKIKTDDRLAIEPGIGLGLSLSEGDREIISAVGPLAAKIPWRLTMPIAADDAAGQALYEQAGRLPEDGLDLREMELAGDDISALIPEEGFMVFAQIEFVVPSRMQVRVVANNTGPIKVYHEGELVTEKSQRTVGILPSCHIQNLPIGRFIQGTYADCVFVPGRNTVMLRLEGTRYAQETNFHLMRIAESTERDQPNEQDLLPPKDIVTTYPGQCASLIQ